MRVEEKHIYQIQRIELLPQQTQSIELAPLHCAYLSIHVRVTRV